MLHIPALLHILQKNTPYFNTPAQSKEVKLLNTIKGRVGIVSQCPCMLDLSFISLLFHIQHLLLSKMSLGVLHIPRDDLQQATVARIRVSFNRKKTLWRTRFTQRDRPADGKRYCAWFSRGLILPSEPPAALHQTSGQWGKNVGCRGPKKKRKEQNPLPEHIGVLCGCVVHLPLHYTDSPSAHSRPRLFPILSIWISFGSNPWTSSASAVCRAAAQSEAVGLDWVTAPQLPELNWLSAFSSESSSNLCNCVATVILRTWTLNYLSLIIHIFIICSHNAGELKPVFKSRFGKRQEMIHLQLYPAPHFTIPFTSGGIGINKARNEDWLEDI